MKGVRLVRGDEADACVVRGVRQLLTTVDSEFVPPLSVRSDTVSTVPVAGLASGALGDYLDAMRDESWLVSLDGDDVIGLISFRMGHDESSILAWSPSLYATTVAVDPGARRAGVGTVLYDAFEYLADKLGVPYLTTRTWTTNASHLGLLQSRGFRVVAELPGHRRDGVGTVYLAYEVASPVRWARPGEGSDVLTPR